MTGRSLCNPSAAAQSPKINFSVAAATILDLVDVFLSLAHSVAVEVKSFVGKSDVADLEDALGQFDLYQILLEETEPARKLYLAVHEIAFDAVFKDRIVLGFRHPDLRPFTEYAAA